MTPPTLTTERYTLRPYARADFDAYAGIFASPRAAYMDGPVGRDAAWAYFTNDVAAWPLYGWGSLTICEGETVLGFTGLTQPPSYPEPEFGWLLTEAAEGQGVATEAARALMDWTWGATDLRAMVSYIDPRNAASIRVAEKLGGLRDDGCARPDDNPLVYRHRRPA